MAKTIRLMSTMAAASTSAQNHVLLSIGGNIGNRVENLSRAVLALKDKGIEVGSRAARFSPPGAGPSTTPLSAQVLRYSCLYETAPQHLTEQPSFLNAALWCRTGQGAMALLRTLKGIEAAAGRDLKVRMRERPRFGSIRRPSMKPAPPPRVACGTARARWIWTLSASTASRSGRQSWSSRIPAGPSETLCWHRWRTCTTAKTSGPCPRYGLPFPPCPLPRPVRTPLCRRWQAHYPGLRHAGSPGGQGETLVPQEAQRAARVARFLGAASGIWAARRDHLLALEAAGAGGEAGPSSRELPARRVVPVGRSGGVWAYQGRSHTMGILNATPDSFSDGGLHLDPGAGRWICSGNTGCSYPGPLGLSGSRGGCQRLKHPALCNRRRGGRRQGDGPQWGQVPRHRRAVDAAGGPTAAVARGGEQDRTSWVSSLCVHA